MTMPCHIALCAALLLPGLAAAQEAAPAQPTETAAAAEETPPEAAPAEVAPAGPTRIAVPNMVAKEADAELATMLTDIIGVEARKVDGFEVIGMSDIEATLGYEQKKMLVGCDDVSCMAEIGGALGVRTILASKVGRVGDTYVLTLRLIDTQDVKVVASTYDTVEGKPDALIAKIRNTVPGLMLRLRDAEPTAAEANATKPAEPLGKARENGTGFVVNWGAMAATAGGVIALMASGVLGAGSLLMYNDYNTEAEDLEVNGLTFHPRNSQAAIGAGQGLGWAFLGTAAVGLAATVGGIVWQMNSQSKEAE